MSSPTKAAAYRAGYLRALKDVEAEQDRIMDACTMVARFTKPEEGSVQRLREIVVEIRDRTCWRLSQAIRTK